MTNGGNGVSKSSFHVLPMQQKVAVFFMEITFSNERGNRECLLNNSRQIPRKTINLESIGEPFNIRCEHEIGFRNGTVNANKAIIKARPLIMEKGI